MHANIDYSNMLETITDNLYYNNNIIKIYNTQIFIICNQNNNNNNNNNIDALLAQYDTSITIIYILRTFLVALVRSISILLQLLFSWVISHLSHFTSFNPVVAISRNRYINNITNYPLNCNRNDFIEHLNVTTLTRHESYTAFYASTRLLLIL